MDDEGFIRRLGDRILVEYGYTVITAPDGETALDLYAERRSEIDLVILDLMMPGMGGRQCLRKLFQLNPAARVLIASSYAPDQNVQDDIGERARGFVGKPFTMNQLLAEVRGALDAI